MPEPGDSSQDPLGRLDARIKALETSRGGSKAKVGADAADGYKVLGQMLGGVLGGVGLGWLADRFAHTAPWGLIGGLLIGAGLSIYSTIRTAMRMSARATRESISEGGGSNSDPDERGV